MAKNAKKQVAGQNSVPATDLEGKKRELELLKRIQELESELSESKFHEPVQEEDFDIRPDAYITVMSMLPWELNLSTGVSGRLPYNFKKMFDTKRILYRDLVEIIDKNQTFAEAGYFYIMDDTVIRKHGLDDTYEKIVNREGLTKLLDGGLEASAIFETANDRQKKLVANMLITKLRNGEDVDMNLVYAVSKQTGIDILQKVEDSKNNSIPK